MILHIFVRSLFETRSFAKYIEFPKVVLTQGQIQIHCDLHSGFTDPGLKVYGQKREVDGLFILPCTFISRKDHILFAKSPYTFSQYFQSF